MIEAGAEGFMTAVLSSRQVRAHHLLIIDNKPNAADRHPTTANCVAKEMIRHH
jgi:hypothetical protein